ncbi:metallophosphoesterase [Rhizobium leguminosarum]|uniref:metallophosphoesterase n=1 Tax=Rhizobium leguminosarum TaxID=384 RepID=UPI0004833176|nr:metallophosphoesterase [Rhizobium leguminosarum]WFT86851.1 metallophosphoesterase [Rhizobium leguminosarum]
MTFVKKYYISDTHLGHERLLSMQPRPFASIDEHDEYIIEAWNSVVGVDDIVYHLGDFAFSLTRDADRIREIFSRLKGRKYLIIGNHDVDKKGGLHPALASLGWAARPEHALRVKDGGRDLWLSHYAARSWPSQPYGAYHFYGHSHGKLPGVGLSRDVGVDMPDVFFQPRTFAELTGGMI